MYILYKYIYMYLMGTHTSKKINKLLHITHIIIHVILQYAHNTLYTLYMYMYTHSKAHVRYVLLFGKP